MKFTKKTALRALRTFLQAVIAALIVAFKDGVDLTSKEAVGSLAIGAVAAGLAALMNLEAKTPEQEDTEELGAGNKMSFADFVNKYLGKGTDYDGVYGVQCVDLAKLYIDKVLGVKPESIGNAYCYYDDFYNTYLKRHFLLIPYAAGVKAQKGDLVVWGKKYNGKSEHGHIAIATGVQDKDSITTYDQNWGGAQMKKVTHSLTGLKGFLRPIEQENINPEPDIKPHPQKKYFKKCAAKYKSLVDALYSIGAKYSFSYRRKVAQANGIKHYIGSAKQNNKLLAKLKAGKLIKP